MQIKFYRRSLVLATALISLLTTAVWAQSRIVNGTVKDPSGAPVPGASIIVKGSTTGVTADADGKFSIPVETNGTVLVVSFIGYDTQEIEVGAQSTIDVSLKENISQLQEVVVTALGMEKDAKSLGYAVTKVDASTITQAREANMVNSLEGRVAGVNISGTAGGPASSSSITIRGVNTLSASGSQPLFVINGIPIDNTTRGSSGTWGGADLGDGISNLNPDDIKEITVLKGATAAALYGSRAASGVIVITTKSGKDRKGFGIEYNGNFTFDEAINYHKFQDEYGSGTNGLKPTDAASAYQSGNLSWGGKLDGSSVPQFDGVSRPYVAQKNNFKNFYRTGSTFTNTVSLSNSNENGSFRFSASDLKNNAIIPNSGLKRNTFNLNVNYKIVPKLTFDLVSNYIIETYNNRPNLSDSPGNANFGVSFLPTSMDVRSLKPAILSGPAPGGAPLGAGDENNFSGNTFITNPWFAAQRWVNNTARNRSINLVKLRYEFTDWLSLQGRVGTDVYHDTYFSVTPSGTAYRVGGSMDANQNNKGVETNADLLLSFNKKVNDFTIGVSAGGWLRKNSFTSTNVTGTGFNVPGLYTPQNLLSPNPTTYANKKLEVQSFYYTADFSYKNFLFLNTTGRTDKFSVLDGKSIFYPSVGASFVFSELMDAPKFTFGKLRASYASTSGDPSSYVYQTSMYYTTGASANGKPQGSVSSTAVPDRTLQPFTMKEVEVGVDLKFFENRLGLDVAYYNRKTSKEIVSATTSVASGYVNATSNFADLSNQGIEILLTGTPVKTALFTWNTSINFTHNTNKITQLYQGLNSITVGTSRSQNAFIEEVVGKSASQVMAFDYKRDASGNPVFDATGLPMQGNLNAYGPGYATTIGGWMNDFNYKGFALSFLIDYKFGGKIFSATDYYAYYYGLHKNTLVGRAENSVIGKGVNEAGQANNVSALPQTYYSTLATNVSSQFVYDASFIKLRQVTLGYKFPSQWFAKGPLRGATFSLVGRNLLILMKHTPNIDPESNYSNTAAQGLELAGYPPTRSYGFNLNLKF